MSFNFLVSSSLLIFLMIITIYLIPINVSAVAQTSSNTINYGNECIRLGISLENCSEEEVLKHRASHTPGSEVFDNQTKIMNWWLGIAVIAAILGGGTAIFLIRSMNIKKRIA